jgi:uncharacterized protein YqiB (DUF1249 family)
MTMPSLRGLRGYAARLDRVEDAAKRRKAHRVPLPPLTAERVHTLVELLIQAGVTRYHGVNLPALYTRLYPDAPPLELYVTEQRRRIDAGYATEPNSQPVDLDEELQAM